MIAAQDCTLYERWLENRDGDAFAELARRHSGVVYDLAVRYSGDAVLAEDLVQEALLDLALAGSRKPIEVGFVAWMARFAMCRARNVRASERARRKRQQTVGERRREDVLMPDDHLEREDELQRALERAEPDERVVLAMRYLHGWEYGRIASALSISEGAARVRVHRALGALRSRLGVDIDVVAGGAKKNGTAGNGTAGNGSAGNGSANGHAAIGAPLLGLLGEMPVHQMPTGLLELGVRNAIDTATAAAANTAASAIAPRIGRLTLQALGLTALLGAATAVSLTAAPSVIEYGDVAQSVASVSVAAPGTTSTGHGAPAAAADWRGGGVPRPPEWDDGVLRRVRPPVRADERDDVADAPSPEIAPELPSLRPLPTEKPVEVLRPTSRDMRAATRDPVSSHDERAGIPVGRAVTLRAVTLGAAPETASVAADRAPGLPVDAAPTAPAVPRLADRPTSRIDDLPQEQADLVNEAALLVARVVAAEGIELDELVADRGLLRRQSRDLRREYRRARQRLRRAAADENAEAFAQETARAAQVSTAKYVLKLLMQVVLADGRDASELQWPDGADVTAALEDVVATLGTLVPEPSLPDGARPEDGLDAPVVDGALPDGALSDGALSDGALPDGALPGGEQ